LNPPPTSLPTSAYDYDLPPDRIAQRPAERRDASRLLVLERATGAVRHRRFRDLPSLTSPGDVVVLNETRVFPARLVGRKPTGAAAEILLLRPLGGEAGSIERGPRWLALVRPGGKLKPGRVVDVADDLRVRILESTPEGERIVELDTSLSVEQALERHGRVPLPPYIAREADAQDRERYQTVYARATGSVAAPTAGLHFTPTVLDALEARGVELARLVLHVGVGTFRPVDEADPARHRMHAEWYTVPADVVAAIQRARSAGAAVWAVGTTVVRALESAAAEDGGLRPGAGWTELFIQPGYRFRVVDRLVTNFHLPRSTLLMLVAAFGGYDAVMAAYREAVERGYRFYSYGDAMAVV
jgi:S-adenosylmethionine:tRNA ribosyltransferase-isomerase